MESKTVYFEKIGPENTDVAFGLVRARLDALGIKKVVLASTTGATARKALEVLGDEEIKLVVVPHQYDFHRKENLFPPELAESLRAAGHAVHFGTMLFHTDGLYGSTAPTLIANVLRCFSQGVKVCFEILLMATDAGLAASGEKVIVMAGSGRGTDTALVMQAASSQNFKNLRVHEIICKPLNPIDTDEASEKKPGKAGS